MRWRIVVRCALDARSRRVRDQVAACQADELVTNGVPEEDAEIRAWVAYGTFEWFVAVNDVWGVEVVPPGVQAALLKILADQPDIVDSGTVTDRAGRSGVSVSTVSDHSGLPTRYTLIFDGESGRLLDFEQTVLEAGKLPLKAPAVISYTLWLHTGRTNTTTSVPR